MKKMEIYKARAAGEDQNGGKGKMKKQEYNDIEIEVIRFDAEDVIVTSGCGGTEPDETTFPQGDNG